MRCAWRGAHWERCDVGTVVCEVCSAGFCGSWAQHVQRPHCILTWGMEEAEDVRIIYAL
jgi:hypothetical protein